MHPEHECLNQISWKNIQQFQQISVKKNKIKMSTCLQCFNIIAVLSPAFIHRIHPLANMTVPYGIWSVQNVMVIHPSAVDIFQSGQCHPSNATNRAKNQLTKIKQWSTGNQFSEEFTFFLLKYSHDYLGSLKCISNWQHLYSIQWFYLCKALYWQ